VSAAFASKLPLGACGNARVVARDPRPEADQETKVVKMSVNRLTHKVFDLRDHLEPRSRASSPQLSPRHQTDRTRRRGEEPEMGRSLHLVAQLRTIARHAIVSKVDALDRGVQWEGSCMRSRHHRRIHGDRGHFPVPSRKASTGLFSTTHGAEMSPFTMRVGVIVPRIHDTE
jgi:hypothetical protein